MIGSLDGRRIDFGLGAQAAGIAAFFVAAGALTAQEPTARAYLEPPEVEVGEQFQLIVEVSGVAEVESIIVPPIFPFPDLPEDGSLPFSTEIRPQAPGQSGGTVVVSYSYIATGAGSVDVGPVLVTADGRSLETGIVTLVVQEPAGVSVRARLEPAEVRLWEEFSVIVEVSGVETLLKQPALPDLGAFAMRTGGGRRRGSTRFEFIATERGTHEIGRVSVTVGDRVYESEPLTLVVNDEPPAVTAHAAFNTDETWVGGEFVLVVHVVGVRELEEDPVLPDIPGVAELVRAPSPGGWGLGGYGGVSRFVVGAEYRFRALAAGEFEIGPIRFRAADQTVRTEPVSLIIRDGPADPVVSSDELRVTTEADKRRVYVGEPVVVSYRILSRGSRGHGWSVQQVNVRALAQDGFREQEPGPLGGDGGGTRFAVDGREYDSTVWRREAFVPLQPGELTIDPGEVEVLVYEWPMRPPLGSLSDMDPAERHARSSGSWTPMAFATDPIPIEVMPLPGEGRPDSFRGRVGRLEVASWVDRTDAVVGDTVTLQVEFAGEGHSGDMSELEIAFPEGFEVLGPEVGQSNPRGGNGARGGLLAVYRLVARAEGNHRIPAIEVSWFDLATGSYGTSRSGSFDLTVGSGERE